MLQGYWYTTHGLASLSVLCSGLPWWAAVLSLAVLGAHLWQRVPVRPPRVVLHHGCLWTVPDWGVVATAPGPGSLRTAWLVRVVLHVPHTRRRVLLLARDLMSGDEWRRLQVLVSL